MGGGYSMKKIVFSTGMSLVVCLLNCFIHAEEWPYLLSEPLKSRYAVASYLLRDCDEIIEIGGYKTPISGFVLDKKVTVIDPKTEPKNDKRVRHFPVPFQDWDNQITSLNYGVIILGLDLHLPDESMAKII